MSQIIGNNVTVECCGERLRAEVSAVQEVLTRRGLPPAAQAREWRRVQLQYADPQWMALCLEQAERMAALDLRGAKVDESVGVAPASVPSPEGRRWPASLYAERHFVWMGERLGVTRAMLNDFIGAMAAGGLVGSDAMQQAALRRGLGMTLSSDDPSQPAPWVTWLGDGDELNYLVNRLWRDGLIDCAGGTPQKWKTLCGVFLRRDGTLFEQQNIKCNRCASEKKIKNLNRLFDRLR